MAEPRLIDANVVYEMGHRTSFHKGGMTMDVKKKLVELIRKAHKVCKAYKSCHDCPRYGYGSDCVYLFFADHLIANGVTVQEPQKPIEHKLTGCGIKIGNAFWGRGTTVYKCPKCGNFISKLYDYCFKCGQPFDWGNKPDPELPKGE